MKSHNVISSSPKEGSLRSQIVILEPGKHLRYRPYAFTEQGVAMLSSVLRSPRAVAVNVEIMRAFVRLRQMLFSHAELARKVDLLESNRSQASRRRFYDYQPVNGYRSKRSTMANSRSCSTPFGS